MMDWTASGELILMVLLGGTGTLLGPLWGPQLLFIECFPGLPLTGIFSWFANNCSSIRTRWH